MTVTAPFFFAANLNSPVDKVDTVSAPADNGVLVVFCNFF